MLYRCGRCGKTLPMRAAFCTRCGQATSLNGYGQRRATDTPTAPRTPPLLRGAAMFFLAVAFGIPALVIAWYWLRGFNTHETRAVVERVDARPGVPRNSPVVRTPLSPSNAMQAVAPPRPPPPPEPSPYEPVAIDAPQFPGDRLDIALPEPFREYHVGGGGRYHVFYFHSARSLGVFDASKGGIAARISLEADDVRFAAGLGDLMVVVPSQKLIHRYDLSSSQLRATARLPRDEPLKDLHMAPAGNLLYLVYPSATITYDVKQMRPVDPPPADLPELGQDLSGMRLSLDGQFACVGRHVIQLTAGQRHNVGESAPSYGPTWYQPSADGRLVFRVNTLFDRRGTRIEAPFPFGALVPGTDPRYFWSVSSVREGKGAGAEKTELGMHSTDTHGRLFTLKVAEPLASSGEPAKYGYTWDPPGAGVQTLWHLPTAKLLVLVLPDRVVLRRFDLFDELDKSGDPYLFVDSLPPLTVRRGETLVHRVTARSSAGPVRFTSVGGPDGIRIDRDGTITWHAPLNWIDEKVSVHVTLEDQRPTPVHHYVDVVLLPPR